MKLQHQILLPLVLLACSCGQQPVAESTQESFGDITVEEAVELLESNPEITVIDVRTPAEFADGHITGAINTDYNDDGFREAIAALDTNGTYLVHCASGGRSGKSVPQFEALEFQKVYHLPGGMNGWKEAGLPVEK